MLPIKFQGNRLFGSGKKILGVFTIDEHDGHLGHVT